MLFCYICEQFTVILQINLTIKKKNSCCSGQAFLYISLSNTQNKNPVKWEQKQKENYHF